MPLAIKCRMNLQCCKDVFIRVVASFGQKKKKNCLKDTRLSSLTSRLDHIASSLIDHEHPNRYQPKPRWGLVKIESFTTKQPHQSAVKTEQLCLSSVQSHRPDSHSLLVINFRLAHRLLSPSSFGQKKQPQRHSLVLSLLTSRLDHIASSLIDHEHPNNAPVAVNCGGTCPARPCSTTHMQSYYVHTNR